MKFFLFVPLFLILASCGNKPVVSPQINADRGASLSAPGARTLPGMISGQVLNLTDDSAIAGATVTIKRGRNIITTAVTDAQGFFKVIGLPEEIYHVTAAAKDFGTLTIGSVPVTAGVEVTTHFILIPATTSDFHFLSASATNVSKRKI